MNYYDAKQRLSDGRWDYTCNNRPTGYCRPYEEIDPQIIPVSESQLEEYRATAHKHHSHGHATEQEARECYREYLLDHSLSLGRKMSNQQLKCKSCGEWTQGFAEINNEIIVLCDQHNNRPTVETLFEAPGWSCSSW